MNDLISVVVPIYNVECYLPSCIDSIIHQSYSNLQIILVNDGSTDNSVDICEKYATIDHRVEVIHKKNGGLSDARNMGIANAKGTFITLVDSDDVISLDMIEYLYKQLITCNGDISVCQRDIIDEDGNLLVFIKNNNFNSYVIYGNNECMHEYLSSNKIDTVAWGKLYKTSLFKTVKYPIGKYHEDVFTTYKLVALSNIISVNSERKYLYRIRKTSITQAEFSPKHLDAIEGKEELANFILKYYPQEYLIAKSGIIYAANQCLWKMGVSHSCNNDYIDLLQSKYRRYEWAFLRAGRNRLISKLFSMCAYCSVLITVKIISIISNFKR